MAELRTTPISVNIRRLREAQGWSRRTLADKTGTSEANIARVELYGHTPKLDTIEAWAAALDVTVSDLLAASEQTA